jgi:hypothetical protein
MSVTTAGTTISSPGFSWAFLAYLSKFRSRITLKLSIMRQLLTISKGDAISAECSATKML